MRSLLLTIIFAGAILFAGCDENSQRNSNIQPRLELTGVAYEDALITGDWSRSGSWYNKQSFHSVYITINHSGGSRGFSVQRSDLDVKKIDEGGYGFCVELPAGVIKLSGEKQWDEIGGEFVFHVSQDYMDQIAQIEAGDIEAYDVLELAIRRVEPVKLKEVYALMSEENISLSQIVTLVNSGVTAEYIQEIRQAGVKLNVDELTKARRYGVSASNFKDFKEAGYNYSLDDIIKIRRYGLKVEHFTSFRDAGRDFGIDDVIKARRYGLNGGHFADFDKAGYKFNMDELIKARRYGISADWAGDFSSKIGKYSLDDLIKLRRYGLSAGFIAEANKGNANYSIDNIIKLKRYGVSTDYIQQLNDADISYSADDIVSLKRYGVSVSMVTRLREAGGKYSVDDVVLFKRYGVSADYVCELQEGASNKLTAQEIVDLKRKGIAPETIKKFIK